MGAFAEPIPRIREGARTTHFEAELVRRQGGEWVIVTLAPGSKDGSSLGRPAGDATRKAIAELLRTYARSLERGDVDALSKVWLMNPFEREGIERLLREKGAIRVDLELGEVQVRGDHVWVGFDQRVGISTLPAPRRRKGWRGLAAHDSVGNWTLKH